MRSYVSGAIAWWLSIVLLSEREDIPCGPVRLRSGANGDLSNVAKETKQQSRWTSGSIGLYS